MLGLQPLRVCGYACGYDGDDGARQNLEMACCPSLNGHHRHAICMSTLKLLGRPADEERLY